MSWQRITLIAILTWAGVTLIALGCYFLWLDSIFKYWGSLGI